MKPDCTVLADDADRSETGRRMNAELKVVRALVSRETSSAGAATDDARGCAKLALVSIERSRSALDCLRGIGGDRGARAADPLIALLDTLASGLDKRFPDAGSFVRFGLDCPVA
jgi:hypothetical protein